MGHQGTMIVAVVAVTVVQSAVAEIISVIAMRYTLVARCRVIAGAGYRCAGDGIGRVNRDRMFIVVIAVQVMQVSIVQVVDVALVCYGEMSTVFAMNMRMFIAMRCVLHIVSPLATQPEDREENPLFFLNIPLWNKVNCFPCCVERPGIGSGGRQKVYNTETRRAIFSHEQYQHSSSGGRPVPDPH